MAPSGRQIELRHGPWLATVVEVGGGLRALSHEGVPILDGYGADEMAGDGRGQTLIPWPNRLGAGEYTFAGRRVRVPIDEPATGNAIHGLVRWSNWSVAERSTSACVMALRLHPQPAYPFALELRVRYSLGDDGLTVSFAACNADSAPLPFGAGFHPYATAGTALVDDALLTLGATTWLPADGRGIPTGERRAVQGDLDFRAPRAVGPLVLDHCFTDLVRDADGRSRIALDGPAARVVLWMDEAFGYVMIFTGDTLPPERRRRGLAVEPMTCAPDAFNSGEGLRILGPGRRFVGSWGIGWSGAT